MRFLNKLRLTANMMNQVRAHYRNYPEKPEAFGEWQARTDSLFKEAKLKIIANN
jgi:hypothetical protein